MLSRRTCLAAVSVLAVSPARSQAPIPQLPALPPTFGAVVTVSPWAALPPNCLPLLAGRRVTNEAPTQLLTATRGTEGDRVCAIEGDGQGAPARLTPFTDFETLAGLTALFIDHSGRAWALCQPANGATQLIAARRQGWPDLRYDLSAVATSASELSDVVVDIWHTHRAYIADAGGDGALIVVPVTDDGRPSQVDNWPAWRVTRDVGQSRHFTDRPVEPDGPARLAVAADTLMWGVRTDRAVFTLPTAALAVPQAAPLSWRWLRRDYGARIGGIWGDYSVFYLVDRTTGAFIRGDGRTLTTLLTDPRLVGTVRLSLGPSGLLALTMAQRDRPATLWRIAS